MPNTKRFLYSALAGRERKGRGRKIWIECILKLTVSLLTFIIEYGVKTIAIIVISEMKYEMPILAKAPDTAGMGFGNDTERKIVTVLFQSIQRLRKKSKKEEQQR